MTLKIGISGIRGIAGDSLSDDVITNFSKAFAKYLNNGKIVIGSDTRKSKDYIKNLILKTLTDEKCEIIDIGIAPTPTTQLAVISNNADGGIVITASHNPSEWNGLKFIRRDGIFLNEREAGGLIGLYHKQGSSSKGQGTGLSGAEAKIKNALKSLQLTAYNLQLTALDRHIDQVIKNIDVDLIRSKSFKVAIDACNGAGSKIIPRLLKKLNCEIIAINTDISKIPPRGAEPIPENLGSLCDIVKAFGADIGFAVDPDADRLSIVSEKGMPIGEEYSLALAAEFIFSQNSGVGNNIAVTNLSTSRMIDDIAKKYDAKVYRTKVGEVNVSEKMKEKGAIIGGEGNGGVIYPLVGFGRDSLSGIGIILNYMASSNKKISELADIIPKYFAVKDKITLSPDDDVVKTLNLVREKFAKEDMDFTDGIKINFPDGWVHVRASNTEPIIRIIAEARTYDRAKGLIDSIRVIALQPMQHTPA